MFLLNRICISIIPLFIVVWCIYLSKKFLNISSGLSWWFNGMCWTMKHDPVGFWWCLIITGIFPMETFRNLMEFCSETAGDVRLWLMTLCCTFWVFNSVTVRTHPFLLSESEYIVKAKNRLVHMANGSPQEVLKSWTLRRALIRFLWMNSRENRDTPAGSFSSSTWWWSALKKTKPARTSPKYPTSSPRWDLNTHTHNSHTQTLTPLSPSLSLTEGWYGAFSEGGRGEDAEGHHTVLFSRRH